MKTAFIILIVLIGITAIVFGPRIYKDIQKKRNYENTYAIQNVASGKGIRVYKLQTKTEPKSFCTIIIIGSV